MKRINLLGYVRRYQWLLGGLLLLVALFVLAKPPVPADLNYRYQLTPAMQGWPLVTQTAGLVEWSTERVREVYRWNLTAETVARSWPPSKAGTPDATLPATVMIFLGVAANVLIFFWPDKRALGAGLLIVVVFGSLLGAHAAQYSRAAAGPSIWVPNVAATLVTHAEPGHTLGVERESSMGLKDLADRYFEHYVTFTQHRMGNAGKVLATPKRIWFGLSGLFYVLPFAVLLALLSSLTVLVQTISWALFMLSAFAVALAVADGRAGLKVWEHVLVPLLATVALLALLGLALPLVLFAATAVHAMENEVGLLLIGSVFPLILVYLVYRLTRGGRFARNAVPGARRPAESTQLLAPSGDSLRLRMSRSRRRR